MRNLAPMVWNWQDSAAAGNWRNENPAPLVWLAHLPEDENMQARLSALLSAEELERRGRLRMPDDQLRFLAGRTLLRLLLGARLNLPPREVRFAAGPAGKPFVVAAAGSAPPHFSLSHSGKLMVIACSDSREVGVDVEIVRPADDLEAVARRVFAPAALREWLDSADRLTAFYQAWTRHEARLKTFGQGFAGGEAAAAEKLECRDLLLPAGYRGAVAWAHG